MDRSLRAAAKRAGAIGRVSAEEAMVLSYEYADFVFGSPAFRKINLSRNDGNIKVLKLLCKGQGSWKIVSYN